MSSLMSSDEQRHQVVTQLPVDSTWLRTEAFSNNARRQGMTSLVGYPSDMRRSTDKNSMTKSDDKTMHRPSIVVTTLPVTMRLRLQSLSLCLRSARLCLLLWQISHDFRGLLHQSHMLHTSLSSAS